MSAGWKLCPNVYIGISGRVAIIVLELAARKFRTRCWLDSNDTRLFALAQIAAQEREAYAGEVGAAAETSDNDIWLVARYGHLPQSLLADNGLVHEYMVHDAAQTVARRLAMLQCHLHGLRYGYAQVARTLRITCQNLASGLCRIAGRRYHVGAPRIHQQLAIGLLVVAYLDHVDPQVDIEILACQSHCTAPLSASGLRREVFYALLGIVVCLRDCGVGLV